MNDECSLSLWIDLYGQKLLRLAFAYTQNKQLAEDSVQEALLRAYRSKREINDQSKIFSWLARIVINECKRNMKKSIRRVIDGEHWISDSVESAETSYFRMATQQIVHQAVMTLPNKYKIPIILYYFEDISLAEISNVIGRPMGTVKSRLGRGREQLQKLLVKEDENIGYRRTNTVR